jgi:SAM-dependent MidA family methyltransferase
MSNKIMHVDVPSLLTLHDQLAERIRREGPITFQEWMKTALYDPTMGYYNRTDLKRWGREGDYRTSPERTDLFAATFARHFQLLYDDLQRPVEWTIVEAGGGDGQFASGLLRTLQEQYPQVFSATHYVFDEASDDARRRARQRLNEFGDRVLFGSIKSLPPLNPGIVFSNELLDAFPVHRLKMVNDQLFELYVTLDGDGQFEWSLGPLSSSRLAELCEEQGLALANGQIIEVNLGIESWLSAVAKKLQSGYLITVDYGAEAPELYGFRERHMGTLRAYSRHAFVDDVLKRPGEHDITTSVDWTQVMRAGERLGLEVVGLEQQDKFLQREGLLEELERRITNATSDAERLVLTTSAREMILPGGMASSFRVLIQKRVAN